MSASVLEIEKIDVGIKFFSINKNEKKLAASFKVILDKDYLTLISRELIKLHKGNISGQEVLTEENFHLIDELALERGISRGHLAYIRFKLTNISVAGYSGRQTRPKFTFKPAFLAWRDIDPPKKLFLKVEGKTGTITVYFNKLKFHPGMYKPSETLTQIEGWIKSHQHGLSGDSLDDLFEEYKKAKLEQSKTKVISKVKIKMRFVSKLTTDLNLPYEEANETLRKWDKRIEQEGPRAATKAVEQFDLCPFCGSQLISNAKFCDSCGKRIPRK